MQSVPIEQIDAEPVERRIERIYALPVAPEAVRQMLALQSTDLSPAQLEQMLGTRPNLRSQLTACLRLLEDCTGNEAPDNSLAAVSSDGVSRIALALATARSFCYVCNGPLGAHAFWQHALSNAALCYRLAPRGLHRGTAFMAGLLHNIGFMVIAYLFPPEFRMLNRLFASHPELSVTVLERCVLGMGEAQELLSMGHAQTGCWLLREWGMPEELGIVAREHHNPGYCGVAQEYCRLVSIANRLLAVHGVGDGVPDPLDAGHPPEESGGHPCGADIAKRLASVPQSLADAIRGLISHSCG